MPAPKNLANRDAAVAKLTRKGALRLLPKAKNKIIIRLENLADRFDELHPQPVFINL